MLIGWHTTAQAHTFSGATMDTMLLLQGILVTLSLQNLTSSWTYKPLSHQFATNIAMILPVGTRIIMLIVDKQTQPLGIS